MAETPRKGMDDVHGGRSVHDLPASPRLRVPASSPDGGQDVHLPEAGPLLERMSARGWEFDFSQAVWLLERYCRHRTPVGDRGPVATEAIRFRPDVSVGFPATDVRRISVWQQPDAEDPSFQLEVTFLGLYGVATPLPLHYAIDILRRVDSLESSPAAESPAETRGRGDAETRRSENGGGTAAGSTPERDFLDLLHHRLISLFYRAGVKYRYDRAFGMPVRDAITNYLLWLIGLQPSWSRETLGVSPTRMIRYAGLLTQHPRSAVSLEGLLRDYWGGLPVEVQQFIGRWVPLKPVDLNRIGALNSRLGVDLTVGEQVYDISGAFDLRMGPMDWATYLKFLPDGPGYAQTRSIVLLYCIDPLSFALELRLHPGEVPETRLSSGSEAGRLGYTSWVRTDDLPETSVRFDATFIARTDTSHGDYSQS